MFNQQDGPLSYAVPGGWIFYGGPLIVPVLVRDPIQWAMPNTLLREVNSKVNNIMATIADVQAALASVETKEATIIGLLKTEAATLADTQAQLAAAIAAGSDPVALQAVVDKMTADGVALDDAIASIVPPVVAPPAP